MDAEHRTSIKFRPHSALQYFVEFQNEPITISNNSKQDGQNLNETYRSHGKAVSSSLLPFEQQHLKIQRMESAADLEGYLLTHEMHQKKIDAILET